VPSVRKNVNNALRLPKPFIQSFSQNQKSSWSVGCLKGIYIYLKGRNFCGKKILQMFLPKTAKLSSRKNLKSCQCKILEYQWTVELNSRKTFQISMTVRQGTSKFLVYYISIKSKILCIFQKLDKTAKFPLSIAMTCLLLYYLCESLWKLQRSAKFNSRKIECRWTTKFNSRKI